jgi:hypothetical protein
LNSCSEQDERASGFACFAREPQLMDGAEGRASLQRELEYHNFRVRNRQKDATQSLHLSGATASLNLPFLPFRRDRIFEFAFSASCREPSPGTPASIHPNLLDAPESHFVPTIQTDDAGRHLRIPRQKWDGFEAGPGAY